MSDRVALDKVKLAPLRLVDLGQILGLLNVSLHNSCRFTLSDSQLGNQALESLLEGSVLTWKLSGLVLDFSSMLLLS